jgi:uncharacterized protein
MNSEKVLELKIEKIKAAIQAKESAVIAFSGGVDSATLASLAFEALGNRALAVTIDSELFPRSQLENAIKGAHELGVQHEVISFSQLSVPYFAKNTINRCYFCKKALLETLIEFAEKTDHKVVLEGTNASEIKEKNRPGYRAVLEAGIKVFSPFVEFEVTKEEIRKIASSRFLSAAQRPSAACLATRFPYGQVISKKELNKVEMAEKYLFSLGFTQFRVRVHGKLARIEVISEEFEKALLEREKISAQLKALGFEYISLDLEGFRSGSMDEPYQKKTR